MILGRIFNIKSRYVKIFIIILIVCKVDILKDEKTKEKEAEIIELVNSFCIENLNEEYNEICVNLVKKLGRKHDVPFKRGKLDIWASSIIYAIAQINCLFDKSSIVHISPDTICDFFNTNKSTVSNKAHTIRDMCNLRHFDEEFSSSQVLDSMPKFAVDSNTGLIIPLDDDLEDIEGDQDEVDVFFDNIYKLVENDKIDEALKILDSIPEDDPEYLHSRFYKHFIENFRDKGYEGNSIGDFVPDEDFISDIVSSSFEDFDPNFLDDYVEFESRIYSPYSLKCEFEDLDDDFVYDEVRLPNAVFQVCNYLDCIDDLDEIVVDVGEEFCIDPNMLKDFVISGDYVIDNSDYEYIIGKLDEYNPKQLKKLLKEHKLKRSGSKDELIERLLFNVSESDLPFSVYELSSKGRDLISDSERSFFSEYFGRYSYNEFKEYCPSGDFKANLIKFFNKHKNLSKERKDYFAYLNASYSLANLYSSMDDYLNALYNIIDNLIFEINYIFFDMRFYAYYIPLNVSASSLLCFVFQTLSFNDFEDTFNKVCRDFEFELKIPKNVMWEIFKNIVNDLDYRDILEDALEEYVVDF